MEQAGQKQARWWSRILCSLCLVLAIILAPPVAIASHGPGANSNVLSALADDLAHDHSHALADGGPGAHDATDHDHQTVALIPPSAHPDRDAMLAGSLVGMLAATGREREGLRRPPRGRA